MKLLMSSIVVLVLSVSVLIPTTPLKAQNFSADELFSGVSGNLPGVDLSGFTFVNLPTYPKPGQAFQVRLDGYAVDLMRASITWTVNDRVVADGPGKRVISLTAPAFGESIVIGAYVLAENGRSFTLSKIFTSTTVDMVWEAETYAPPFYRGKSGHAPGSMVRVTAFPNFVQDGVRLDPKDLIYEWRQNDTRMPNISGKGQYSVVVKNTNVFGPLNLRVEVTSPDRRFSGQGTLSLRPEQPEIVFYEDHPLLGILYEHALGKKVPLNAPEASIVASPYNFSLPPQTLPSLSYTWFIDGIAKPELGSSDSIIVRGGENGEARASAIDLRIRSNITYLQSARQNIVVSSGGTQ